MTPDTPAFPTVFQEEDGGKINSMRGMTLRDWFAGQALAGLVANPGGPFQADATSGWTMVNCSHDHVARECLRLADAMLEARKS